VKTNTQSIRVAATGVVMMLGPAVQAQAQGYYPYQQRGGGYNAESARAAAVRDAVVRAQLAQIVRQRQAAQIAAIQAAQRNAQIAAAQTAQRNAQILALRAVETQRQQSVQRAAQVQALSAISAQRQQAAQRSALLQALTVRAAQQRQQAVQRSVQVQLLSSLAARSAQSSQAGQAQILSTLVRLAQQRSAAASQPSAQLQALQALTSARPQSAPLFSGSDSPEQLINRLNSLSSSDVNALMSRPNVLNQFTPAWIKNAPGGNALAQFGIGNGLMKELGSTDLKKILDPKGLDAIKGKLRRAQILGGLAAGQAAQNKVSNDVRKHDSLLAAEKDAAETIRQLNEAASRTGVDSDR
jgi:hypothetical protein